MLNKLVVVGAGVGGVAVAVAARERGWEGEILILDADDDSPYDRPPLSKEFLTKGTSAIQMRRVLSERLVAAGVDLQTGRRATGIDRGRQRLSIENGDDVAFDRLVIATGSNPRRLAGLDGLPNVHYISSLASAAKTRAALRTAKSVVVVGGGFIGCEVASSAVAMGLSVTVVEAGPRLAGRVLPEDVASALFRLHVENGVDVRLGVSIKSGTPNGAGLRLELDDGSSLAADMVVVGIGTVLPNLDWLSASGLSVDGGIMCESDMQVTSEQRIYAVGDVAAWWHRGYRRRLRVEHWTTTRLQAAVVSRVLVGERAEMRSVPYVWSDQHGIQIQHVGDPDLTDVDVERRVSRNGGQLFVYHRAGEVIGATAIDARADFMKIRRDLADGPRQDDEVDHFGRLTDSEIVVPNN